MKLLSTQEIQNHAIDRLNREIKNSNIGFDVDITTLTGIKARITEQVFYTARPSEFMPVEVGQNPWAATQLTYISMSTGGDFASGIVDPATNSGRLETVDAQIDSILVPRKEWAKENNYNLMELAQAQVSGNWSIVETKETARFKNWQLGIQECAFLGLADAPDVKGLLTQTNVNSNLTVITKKISAMSATEFNAFLSTILPAYFANANSTALPTHFTIPMGDYLGLSVAADEAFPLKSKLERMYEVFKSYVPDFKIQGVAYADKENSGLAVDRYVLYKGNDPTSLTMEIPVDYTTTIYDTVNGFNYRSVGYGQFAGVQAYRPLEMLYFDF